MDKKILLAALVLLLIPFSLAYTDALLDKVGQKAWYSFDNPTDNLTNDYDGTIYNLTTLGVMRTAAGIIGNGISGTGNDGENFYIPGQTWVSSGSITIVAWVNPDDNAGHYAIAAQSVGTSSNWVLRLKTSTGIIEVGNFGGLSGPITASTATVVGAEGYAMVAWVHNTTGPVNKLYKNGVEVALAAGGTATIDTYGNEADLGAYAQDSGNQYEFKGDYDEVAIWNRALTDLEIFQLYNGGAGTTLSDLGNLCDYTSGDWDMDASDNCVITSPVVMDAGGVLTITGTSSEQVTFEADVTNAAKVSIINARLTIMGSLLNVEGS